ncbi:hypothetical protein BC834DRAFT_858941 [Gloeopeniophorella convolvens]|nr:hypothetical protein BC834DRAFT_858941 [Gloeopeniophorella convolvens]
MTAVLSASDALRKDNIMASLDDNHINYSSSLSSVTDWKAKYYEVAEMLQETKNELDDFHTSSKELEEELERELQRTEKAQQDLKVKVERAENERDSWKSKYMSLQTNHNTTTASLQRELDTLRQESQKIKVQLRELEMGNDDLERNERAVASSLSDIEAKYSRALEEKILLEHELLDKAHLEEECQRLKDELRDSNAEVSVLKDQLQAAQARVSKTSPNLPTSESRSLDDSSLLPNVSKSSDDNLLHTQPPPDLDSPDLTPECEVLAIPETSRQSTSSADAESGKSILLQRAGFTLPRHKITSPQTPTSLSRSTTLPPPSRLPPRTAVNRSTPQSAAPSASSTAATAPSKNRGVQMVSEMRAKVKNLEQKIHTRVPRLRMGSTSRPNPPTVAVSTSTSKSTTLSSTSGSQSSHRRPSEERSRPSFLSRHSSDIDENKRTPAGDSSGWVLIMEDSPSPTRPKERDFRRTSSPPSAASFHAFASLVNSPQLGVSGTQDVSSRTASLSGIRRPQSRLSTSTEGRSSVSTTATVSSIPTPTSRPATPTLIPLPSAGLYAHSSTAGATGLKRSNGPTIGGAYSKRSSLSSSTADSPTNSSFLSDSGLPHRNRPPSISQTTTSHSTSSSPSSFKESLSGKSLSQTPHSNVTVRSHSRLPAPSTPSPFSQSRIGRPNFGVTGRRSAGGDISDVESRLLDARDKGRARSNSRRG